LILTRSDIPVFSHDLFSRPATAPTVSVNFSDAQVDAQHTTCIVSIELAAKFSLLINTDLTGKEDPTAINNKLTRMWANAQPDGRPAEHRWRPLFNAAKFG